MRTIAALLLTTMTFTSLSNSASIQREEKDEEKDIVVAIIDTGVDIHHPLIKNNLWVNSLELQNGKDNDGNGFAGDLHGWNFASNSNDISDHHGHGTHVAGIVQQQAKSNRVKFMILKYYDPLVANNDNIKNTVDAIRYAVKMKADIINYSGGGNEKSLMEENAIREAQGQGIIFVAAAGNEGRNTDLRAYYPAGYGLDNIISVAAMDSNYEILPTSNFGSRSVHIAAPGKNIFSALPDGKFGYMTGTSQATAWISGMVANLMVKKPWLAMNAKTLKESLVRSEVLNLNKAPTLAFQN